MPLMIHAYGKSLAFIYCPLGELGNSVRYMDFRNRNGRDVSVVLSKPQRVERAEA